MRTLSRSICSCSAYTPGLTLMISPSRASASAAWIVRYGPFSWWTTRTRFCSASLSSAAAALGTDCMRPNPPSPSRLRLGEAKAGARGTSLLLDARADRGCPARRPWLTTLSALARTPGAWARTLTGPRARPCLLTFTLLIASSAAVRPAGEQGGASQLCGAAAFVPAVRTVNLTVV